MSRWVVRTFGSGWVGRRLWVGLLVAVVAVVLVLGLGAAPALAVCSEDGPPTDTTAPGLTPSTVGPVGQVLQLTEGAWVAGTPLSPACTIQISSVKYTWYRGTTSTGVSGTFSGSSGGSAHYTTQSADVGHLVTAQVTACDNLAKCTTVTANGSFAAHATPSGLKVGNNTECYTGSLMATVQTDTQAAHSTWVRIFEPWKNYETGQNAYSTTEASRVASCIQTLHSYGKSVLVDFVDTPNWAQASTTDQQMDPPDNTITCPNESCYGVAAAHLASESAIQSAGGIDAIEVWNEPDTGAFDGRVNCGSSGQNGYWCGSVGQYEALLKGAYAALHSLTNGPLVVLGGTAHIDYAWYSRLFSDGYGGDFDILGIHTYPSTHSNTDIPAILNGSSNGNNTLNKIVGLTSKPIWITEMGGFAGNNSNDFITDAQNAQMLTDFYKYIRGQQIGTEPVCPSTTCGRIQVGMWFTDWLSSSNNDWAMLSDPGLNPKPEMAAFVGLP